MFMSLFLTGEVSAQIEVQYARTIDFSHYKTFTFKRGKVVNNVVIDSSVTAESDEIKNHLVPEFEKKGLNYTNSNPDLIVSFVSELRQAAQMVDMGPTENGTGARGYGNFGPSTWWEEFNPTYARIYSQNLLIVDVIDAKTHRLIWRGTSKIKGANPKAQKKSMNKKIKKILKYYPHGK